MQDTLQFPFRAIPRYITLVSITLAMVGCDMLGIETPAIAAAKKEAEGKAIGSACRHAVRSIEDCYRNNPKASKAAVFDGWKEMDAYMRENSIDGMPFVPPVTGPDEALVTPESESGKGKDGGESAKKGEH
jgi:hypothetical protein